MIQFPKDFLWGAATSSYQVEGNNTNADWWPWEKKCGHTPSGDACRHYEFYEADFDIAKSLNHNAHRLSIEWSRIEPVEGEFDQQAIDHYVAVIKALKARGIEPIVTLHHFTNPIWLANRGGWEDPKVVDYFVRYVKVVVKALKKDVRYWNTINEPTILTSHAYLFGWWPPQKKSLWALRSSFNNMARAHVEAYRLIKMVYANADMNSPMVGIAHHMQDFMPCRDTALNRYAVELRYRWLNFEFLDRIVGQDAVDFIGFNYYSRQLVDVRGVMPWNLLGDVCQSSHHPVKKNSLGWDIYPQGIYNVLMRLKKFNRPIMITENGICTEDDEVRKEFIQDHLRMIHKAIADGADVRGYLHWSLLDNFEWDKGFVPRFGLVHVNYATQERTIKPSAEFYAQICKSGMMS